MLLHCTSRSPHTQHPQMRGQGACWQTPQVGHSPHTCSSLAQPRQLQQLTPLHEHAHTDTTTCLLPTQHPLPAPSSTTPHHTPPHPNCSEIIKLPPGALKGLKEGKADDMLAAFNIKTIQQLGTWKHYQAAQAIAVLASTEEVGCWWAWMAEGVGLVV